LRLAVLDFALRGVHPDDAYPLGVEVLSCGGARCQPWALGIAGLFAADYPAVLRSITAPRELPRRFAESVSRALASMVGPSLRPAAEAIEASSRSEAEVAAALRAQARPATSQDADPAAATVKRLLAEVPTPAFSEHPLPAKLPPKSMTPFTPSLPSAFRAVRAERAGLRVVAIALSSRLDPGGEVSDGAYWLLESRDGGKSWREPVYLGLRENQPYVVLERSRLSLLRGEVLTLEVEVQELDASTITFPPVSLGLKRVKTGLYLEAKLEDLRRDSDGDGLPDLVEERLFLDPHEKDTDHDGLDDGHDPVPQASATGKPAMPPELMAEFIEKITGRNGRLRAQVVGAGEDKGAKAPLAHAIGRPEPLDDAPVLYIEGQRADFAGFSSPQRLIVLTPDEVELARKRFGVFFPMRIDAVLQRNGRHAFIQFSEGWRGGAFSAEKIDGEWRLKVVSSWIT
jgi:hypothetical protein